MAGPEQRTLFDEPGFPTPARVDSAPQMEAAEKLARHNSRTPRWQARRILHVLAFADRTREELTEFTGIPQTTLCARLRDMEVPNKHRLIARMPFVPLVRKVGKTRRSSYGIHVTVYEITAAGRSEL